MGQPKKKSHAEKRFEKADAASKDIMKFLSSVWASIKEPYGGDVINEKIPVLYLDMKVVNRMISEFRKQFPEFREMDNRHFSGRTKVLLEIRNLYYACK